jgi:hypothetical protein
MVKSVASPLVVGLVKKFSAAAGPGDTSRGPLMAEVNPLLIAVKV